MMYHHAPLLITLCSFLPSRLHASSSPSSSSAKDIFRDVIFASPLKTLTIFDKPKSSSETSSPRSRYLKKFNSGIESERRTRRTILEEERSKRKKEEDGRFLEEDNLGGYEKEDEYYESSEWAEFSQAMEDAESERKKKRIQDAFEKGFSSVKEEESKNDVDAVCSPKSQNKYQFVGVVMPNKGNKVKWYAREKPKGANWSVRVVHPDKAAIMRDLFVRGKIDIYAEYKNKGIPLAVEDEKGEVKKSGAVIEPEYKIKERSWRTLWNFSPKHFFTDRSGMFWRERRIRPGIYTDGQNVYESSYRYVEGKNGMKPLPGVDLSSYLNRYNGNFDKAKILEKVQTSTPDVVLE